MTKISYAGYRFPPEIIQRAVWLYYRFTLSFRDVEDLLAERGIMVSYETIRRWVNHFGPTVAADLRKRRPKPHATWHLDEVYLRINGRMVYLWRAVDAEGEVLDVNCEPLTPFCLSSGNSRGVDFLATLRDEREDLSRKVAFQGSNGVEFGMPFCYPAGNVILGSLVGP